jgi:hypothetical protein
MYDIDDQWYVVWLLYRSYLELNCLITRDLYFLNEFCITNMVLCSEYYFELYVRIRYIVSYNEKRF